MKKYIYQSLEGVFLLDKPPGLSSNDALKRVKHILNIKKAGYTGTLDPFASGLLPLCLGEATKFAQILLNSDKRYIAHVCLGITTDTGDIEGKILTQCNVTCSIEDVQATLPYFRGSIKQIPPMYSAVKRNGRPLYVYARAGKIVDREARSVTIHKLELISTYWGKLPILILDIICSKGTYIRTLAEDIGKALGCGAYLRNLRRIEVGNLMLSDAISLDTLLQTSNELKEYIQPTDTLLLTLPKVFLNEKETKHFHQGLSLELSTDRIEEKGDDTSDVITRVYDNFNRLLGIACYSNYVLVPKRLVQKFSTE